ncbi:hypothetical protein BDY24DRAFT_25245 [Mrakia frigida]|uniref:F-box protein n=1 Tax=Mrakia frigida TaxID=29902 RepID=UPI003FCC15B9
MEQLADETLRLIFSYLANPDSLSKVSKRLNRVSKDPYTRSQFFLVNHGPTHAYWAAFCRSACLTEDVISILHSSGAHISRYLTQMVIHAYTRGRVPACPGRWAQAPRLSFNVFAHFLKLSATLYKEMDPGKNEDDGSKFLAWIRQKQGRKSAREKEVTWEFIESMFKDYGFIPFAPKDYILNSFPAALALDHRILPLAKRNGLAFDEGFRDFVFRKVFESTGSDVDAVPGQRSIAICNAVKDIIELDDDLFVSKNVVGEILMEIETRKAAFDSLKALDLEGHLRFGLGEGVRELIKTFRSTRSISTKGET